jgi:hypothetical protein
MARANAQGPDTLLQTDRDNSQKSTCRSGAGHTFGSDKTPVSCPPITLAITRGQIDVAFRAICPNLNCAVS